MGSHLGAIGFPPDRAFQDALGEVMTRAAHLGTGPEGHVDVYAFDDASGSRTTVTLEDRRVTCLTAGFVPGTRLNVRLGALAANECPYERPLVVDVLDEHGELQYPLAVTIDDLGVSASRIRQGADAVLEVVGIADRFELHADEAAFRATGTPMAVASLIPAGLFAPGAPPAEQPPVQSIVLLTGIVLSAELRTHALFGHPFVTVLAASYGADYVLCLDVADLGGPAAPDVPATGSIISGQFYVSGRLVPSG